MSGKWLALGAVAALAGASTLRRGSRSKSMADLLVRDPNALKQYLVKVMDAFYAAESVHMGMRHSQLIGSMPLDQDWDLEVELVDPGAVVIVFAHEEGYEFYQRVWTTERSLTGLETKWTGDPAKDAKWLASVVQPYITKFRAGMRPADIVGVPDERGWDLPEDDE